MSATYINPVYGRNFPDPFVLKYCGEYWAYGTGLREDGRAFGILRSRDLVKWQEVGGAMTPLPGDYPCYWAPEVTYDNGRFYLYYSVGDGETMHIRLALADAPAGPFVDSGRRLTSEPFAIDPHVFTDDDGGRTLFYATDFLDHPRIGTGTVCDELVDLATPAGQPRPVTRARYDWQIFDPQRGERGGARWHTLEGPFVLKHKGRYYQLFSGGNWQTPTYGVGYATTEYLETPSEWAQACDGERIPPILHTVPGVVIGPGHNSVVRGPDNRQLYCVYHAWRPGSDGRSLAIDPLVWVGEQPAILGPTYTPQPAPPPSTFADFFDGEGRGGWGEGWEAISGTWCLGNGAALADPQGYRATATYAAGVPFLVAEVTLRAVPPATAGAFGLDLGDGRHVALRFRLLPAQNQAILAWAEDNGRQERRLPLPPAFDAHAYHLLRLEVSGNEAHVYLDDWVIRQQSYLGLEPTHITLCAEESAAAFAGFAVTANPNLREIRGER